MRQGQQDSMLYVFFVLEHKTIFSPINTNHSLRFLRLMFHISLRTSLKSCQRRPEAWAVNNNVWAEEHYGQFIEMAKS